MHIDERNDMNMCQGRKTMLFRKKPCCNYSPGKKVVGYNNAAFRLVEVGEN